MLLARAALALALATAAFLSACGGAQHGAASPACPAVADHLLILANRDNGGMADDATAAGMVGEFRRQCQDDHWSSARRTCLAAAVTQEDTLACPGS